MNEKLKKTDEKTIQLTGDCSIIAAAAEDGNPEKLPGVTINVYNGGKINVGYWGGIVVDLKGMAASNNTPILYRHDTYDIDSVLGQTDKVTIGTKINATGAIMGDSDTVKSVVGLAKNGFKFQASMGTTPLTTRQIPEGESVEVNGQTIDGPFTLIVSSKLAEISILPLGADDTTSAAVAAAQTTNEVKMDTKVVTPTADEIKAAVNTEKTRVAGIVAEAGSYPEIMAKAISENWDAMKTKSAVLEAKLAVFEAEKIEAARQAAIKAEEIKRPGAPHIVDGKVIQGAQNVDTITAAVCACGNMAGLEKAFSADILNKAKDVKARSITELVMATLALSGRTLEASHRDPRAFIEAAFSTADIANVLSNVANKFIASIYGINEMTWKEVSAIRNVSDFKTNTGIRLIMSNLLKELAPNGEIQHGTVSDTTRTITADTKGLMLGFTRQNIINDDLGLLGEGASKLAYAAHRTFNTDFWAALEAAVAANFSNDNKNTTTGALTVTTLAAAELLFLALEDDDGNPIGTSPTTLLCGGKAYGPARSIYQSQRLIGATAKSADVNIYGNRFNPVFSAYLSSLPWYLTGNPAGIPMMESAFLNGNQMPIVETAQTDFNTLGIQMRCYYDYGISFAEAKSGVYSTGA